jgi:hypothetical protein
LYVKDPLFGNVKLNCPPAGNEPLNTPVSLVAVCAIVSMFVHVTVPPAEIVTGFGTYALLPSVRAPEGMLTAVVAPVGVGLVGGFELLLPQDAANARAPMKTKVFSVLVMP